MPVAKFDKEVYAECECSCKCGEAFSFYVTPDEDEVIISTKVDGFVAGQRKGIKEFLSRFQIAWDILRGKEYCFQEIVLKAKSFHNFVGMLCDVDSSLRDLERRRSS